MFHFEVGDKVHVKVGDKVHDLCLCNNNNKLEDIIQSCYDQYGDTFFSERAEEYVGFYYDAKVKRECADVEWTPEVTKVDPNMLVAFL